MLASMHGADPLPAALARLRHPGGLQRPARSAAVEIPYVDVDNVGGAETAVRHLSASAAAGSPPSPARRT